MWSEPTKTARGVGECGPPALDELGPAAHRVLELRAVRLDRKRRAGSVRDRAAGQDVVREDEVGRQLRLHRLDVRRARTRAHSSAVKSWMYFASSPS